MKAVATFGERSAAACGGEQSHREKRRARHCLFVSGLKSLWNVPLALVPTWFSLLDSQKALVGWNALVQRLYLYQRRRQGRLLSLVGMIGCGGASRRRSVFDRNLVRKKRALIDFFDYS